MTRLFTRTFLLAVDAPLIAADCLAEGMLKTVLAQLQRYQQNHQDCVVQLGAMSLGQGERWLTPGIVPVEKVRLRNPVPAGPAGWDVLVPALLDPAVTAALDAADLPVLLLMSSRTDDPTWATHHLPLTQSPALARTVKLLFSMGSGGLHLSALLAPGVAPGTPVDLLQHVKRLLQPAAVPANCMDARKAAFLAEIVSRRTTARASMAPVPATDDAGRAKCRMMKAIRKAIADANGIPYTISECTYAGHCDGACPACDAEARQLERDIAARQDAGRPVILPDMSNDLPGLRPLQPLPLPDPLPPDLPDHEIPGDGWYGGLEAFTPGDEFL